MDFLNPQIFRQYDIRGRAERDLTNEVAALLGWAFGYYVRERGGHPCSLTAPEVLVGRDNRLSSEQLRDAFVAGLVSAGCRVVDIGLVVIPVLYYAETNCRPAGAVMITASHNPPEDNGFKLVCRGSALSGEQILLLREIVEGRRFPAGAEKGGPGEVMERDLATPYLDMLKEKIRLGPRPLKVVVDCGNGTGGRRHRAVVCPAKAGVFSRS